jgi:hypothetical protein
LGHREIARDPVIGKPLTQRTRSGLRNYGQLSVTAIQKKGLLTVLREWTRRK